MQDICELGCNAYLASLSLGCNNYSSELVTHGYFQLLFVCVVATHLSCSAARALYVKVRVARVICVLIICQFGRWQL